MALDLKKASKPFDQAISDSRYKTPIAKPTLFNFKLLENDVRFLNGEYAGKLASEIKHLGRKGIEYLIFAMGNGCDENLKDMIDKVLLSNTKPSKKIKRVVRLLK